MPWKPKSHAQRTRPLVPRVKDDRAGSTARGYGSQWQKARLGYLAHHPLCRHCEAEGRTEPATVVDHIKAHKGDMALFWDTANWQPLCKRHHDEKTAREDGAFGRRKPGETHGGG